MSTPFIVRYISQQWLEYLPATNQSRWRMTAVFSDGSTRTFDEFRSEQQIPASHEVHP